MIIYCLSSTYLCTAEGMSRVMCLQGMETHERNLITEQEYKEIKATALALWTSDDPTAGVSEVAVGSPVLSTPLKWW